MSKKKLLAVFWIIALFSSIVLAEFNPQKGVEFLLSKTENGGVDGDIVKTGFAALLFKKIGSITEAEKAADFLKSKEDSLGCFPASNCRIKDTAVAIIALTNLNRDVDKSITFLKNGQSAGLGSGQLLLEVITSGKGNCTASFETNIQNSKSFLVDEGRFTSCGNSYFLDLNSNCIKGGLASSFPGTSVDIDCTGVSSSTIIGTLYKRGNDIFLGESFNSKIAKILIDSGCYGINSKTNCNLDPSLFAGWALMEAEADFNIISFLKQNFDPNSPLHLSLLRLITNEERFLKDLKAKQGANGGFDNSVSATAFALIAFGQETGNEVQKAREFLKNKQSDDGSWNGNTLDTVLALIALSDLVTGDFTKIAPGSITCDRDGVCESELGEDEDTCPRDCIGTSEPKPTKTNMDQGPCNDDRVCDRESGEDEINCPIDCVKEEEKPVLDKEPTEESSGSGKTILIIVIILVLVVLVIFGLKKLKGSKKENKSENKFEFKPFTAQLFNKQTEKKKNSGSFSGKLFKPVNQTKTAVESELEKSIEEAKKLLRK